MVPRDARSSCSYSSQCPFPFGILDSLSVQTQDLVRHFRAIPGVSINSFHRSTTGFQDIIFHAKKGLQACLQLDASEYQCRQSTYTIRVKPVSESLVDTFKIVSHEHASSLSFQNIYARSPEDVLRVAEELAKLRSVTGPLLANMSGAANCGVLYFDRHSTAISFMDAIDSSPILSADAGGLDMANAQPVKLSLSTDCDSHSSKLKRVPHTHFLTRVQGGRRRAEMLLWRTEISNQCAHLSR